MLFWGLMPHKCLWRSYCTGASGGEVGRALWLPGGEESPWGGRYWGRGLFCVGFKKRPGGQDQWGGWGLGEAACSLSFQSCQSHGG